MTEVTKVVVGVLAAVVVYVIGQLLSKFLIEPLSELRKAIGEVRFNLSFHAPTILTPIGRTAESSKAAEEALLKNSSDLIVKLHAVPFYVSFGTLPCRRAVNDAAVELRGLSTYMSEKGNASVEPVAERVTKIEGLLRLKPLE
jgi:hypothetical protein